MVWGWGCKMEFPLVEGGDHSRDLFCDGREPNKGLLEGALQDANCEGEDVKLFPWLFLVVGSVGYSTEGLG